MNFKKVTHNGQPVRGLWERNGIFYAQITVKKGKVTRKRLEAETVPQAVSELHYVKHGVRLGEIVQHGKDSFADVAARYQADSQHKRAGTVASEASCITRLGSGFSRLPISEIDHQIIKHYRNHRQGQGIANSTINTEMSVASKVFQYAIDNGIITDNPVSTLKPLKCAKPERQLLSNEDIKKLCDISTEWMCDYLRFLQYTGAREQEALRVRWVDVEFSRNRVHIGADGLSKNGKSRYVEMSEALRAHLEYRHSLRQDDVNLFPQSNYRGALEIVRGEAGLPWIGFHDFRRHFVSQCVMSGIDFATIANWCGHSDGGALLARKYTFLHSQHVASQAKKLQFS